jgi:4-amino-4-deoxy-L-arabinose transferase-like glycosyltransferase
MLKKYSIDLEKNTTIQYLLGCFCLLVYTGVLFFPLMDKDAAHHANIALYMYEHNDWITLMDRGHDYLDKPHLLFWSSLLSFKIFGVNAFAHRLPAVIFSLVSLYSTYKLAKHLSSRTTAKIALIILATAQAFVLSVSDARMETPLTAGIIFSIWQLIVYTDKRKFLNIFLAALGTAVAFSTKGWIGPVIIFISTFFYIGLQKKWNVFNSFKTWLFIPIFFIFISPVLYAYYIQYDLHPEKVIRGRGNRSGIHFILWDQLFERSQGFDMGKKGRNSEYFFLYHTFLWAFFPWCVFAVVALVFWFKRIFGYKKWKHPFNFAVLSFAFILFAISFSKFKMPHYIIMLLPLAALFTAAYLRYILSFRKGVRFYYPFQLVFAILVSIAIIVLNYYFFPPRNIFIWVFGSALLIGLLAIILKRFSNRPLKIIYMTAAFSLVFNFFMNFNFFPSLLKYQGGNELVRKMEKENIVIPREQIILLEPNAHSFEFARKEILPHQSTDNFAVYYPPITDKYFLLSSTQVGYLQSQGFEVKPVVYQPDYNVTTIKMNFLNPSTREKTLDTLMLAKIFKQ